MVNYKYKDLFLQSHIDKQLKIAADDGSFTATNSDIHFEDFELTESLCSDSELRFGSCEASMVKFQIRNAFIPLAGKWLTVTETLDGNTDVPFQYGRYKVFSDKPTADKEYRDILAYDAMYDILGADLSAWYNTILPNKDSTVTMKQFRKSFIAHFDLEEVVPENGLVNDNMTVERTIAPEQISGKDVITAICEINGCFGHIGRDGKFHYIYLPQDIGGLYPVNNLFPDHAPDYLPQQQETGHLYPQDPKGERMGTGRYKECQYEDYVVRQINKIQIRQEENDIGTIYPKTEPSGKDNSYVIQDNFLVYGKLTEELDVIAENIYGKIIGIVYRPFSADCIGNPCFEVGDPLRFSTKHKIVESYILSRTLKGIQNLNDSYSSKGLESRSQNVNSLQKSIIQLKGKANILTRTIEETRLEMYDIGEGLNNTISVTAAGLDAKITSEQNRASAEEERLSNSISVTASGLEAEIERAQEAEDGLQKDYTAKITATSEELSSEITEKTQYTDTSPYTVTRKGSGIPTTVYVGEYYLDEDSLKIYFGVAEVPGYEYTTWEMVASYDFNEHQAETNGVYRYDLDPSYESAIEEYNVPNRIYEDDLDNYDWGTSGPDLDNGSPGDVWLEVTERINIAYWLCGSDYSPSVPAHWQEVGTATIVDLPELSSKVTQTSEGLKSTVKKGDVSSEISQEAGKISITGNRIAITSQNFQLTDDGKVNCTGATVSGTIESTGDRGKTRVTNGGFYILNKNNKVAGCFYGSDSNNGGRLDIYTSAGNEGDLAFSASAMKTDVYAGGLDVHKNGVVIRQGGLSIYSGGATVTGNLSVSGTKNRVVKTKDYGKVLHYCYETATPMFGDVGTGKTDENGFCYIYFDPLFSETVNTSVEYCVFLQKEGNGDLWIEEKGEDFFKVLGTPNLSFSWEAKAKQSGYEYMRMENFKNINTEEETDYESIWENMELTDYEKLWNLYLENYEKLFEESEEDAV